MWPRGIDGLSFHEEIIGDFVGRYEDSVVSSQICLVNGAINFSPFIEFQPCMFCWELENRSQDWNPYLKFSARFSSEEVYQYPLDREGF